MLGQHPRKFTRHVREQIGYMPQHFVLYEELTASENVSFVASLFGLLWPKRGRRVREVLKLVDLWEARGRRARQLRAACSAAWSWRARWCTIRCCCSSTSRRPGSIRCCARRSGTSFAACATLGRTLVVTTQYVGEAEYCDQVAVLARGRLIALAAPEELRRMALGGEVIEIETAQAFDGSPLERVPGVRERASRARRATCWSSPTMPARRRRA